MALPIASPELTSKPLSSAVRAIEIRAALTVLPGEGRTHGPSSFGSPGRGRQARRSPIPSPRRSPRRDVARLHGSGPLQNYEQWHNLHTLQVATGSCQVHLEVQGGQNFAGVEPPVPLAIPPQMGGHRNIGCRWWPIGSDADRDCAAGGRRF